MSEHIPIRIAGISVSTINWPDAVRIIRSIYPPIDLFEDIADPADWALLISAEQKTNPRIMENIGNLNLIPVQRRVGGIGASYVMAPFTHVSPDRKSRFGDGTFGVLYAGKTFEVALLETMYHHARFMMQTKQAPGWTSQFREIILDIDASLHDLRGDHPQYAQALDPDSYTASQLVAASLRNAGSDGIVYPSVRSAGGECAGLFYPDLATRPVQGRHLDYHWDGTRVDLYRLPASGEVFRIIADEAAGSG